MIREILATLEQPDAQPGDWYGWVTNEAGHAALVGVPAAMILLGLGVPAWLVPAAVAAVYGVIWEGLFQPGTIWSDSLSDTAHVAAGATLITAALSWGFWLTAAVLAAWGVLLAVGIARRLNRGN